MIRPLRFSTILVALLLCSMATASCADGSGARSDAPVASPFDLAVDSGAAPPDRPVVVTGSSAYRAPGADPTRPLGQLRARHLPVWSAELDWAFPPQTCDSAWELDAIAQPDPTADAARLDDLPTAGALAVMRYEYLYSRALTDPTSIAQLCVAVGAVEPVRSENLAVLASYLSDGLSRQEPAAYPQQVTVLAATTSGMLAVACVAPGYATVISEVLVTMEGEEAHEDEPAREVQVVQTPPAPVRLQAYLLTLARGIEDAVVDVSLRVSQVVDQPAPSCAEMTSWISRWQGYVHDWIAEGQIWEVLETTITAEQACRAHTTEIPADCPEDWPI